MKNALILVLAISIFSCTTRKAGGYFLPPDIPDHSTIITQSLFTDHAATISEEGIQKVLEGKYHLPNGLRVAIVKLGGTPATRFWWSDEEYLKTQQAYLDLFAEKFRQSSRVEKVSVIPDLLISKMPSFTNIREAAVRMQADIVVAYSISNDLYSKYKLFSSTELKGFATTQLIVMDVRTGLIPFSTIVTRDFSSKKEKDDFNLEVAQNRVLKSAVLLTIDEIGGKITAFLNAK